MGLEVGDALWKGMCKRLVWRHLHLFRISSFEIVFFSAVVVDVEYIAITDRDVFSSCQITSTKKQFTLQGRNYFVQSGNFINDVVQFAMVVAEAGFP